MVGGQGRELGSERSAEQPRSPSSWGGPPHGAVGAATVVVEQHSAVLPFPLRQFDHTVVTTWVLSDDDVGGCVGLPFDGAGVSIEGKDVGGRESLATSAGRQADTCGGTPTTFVLNWTHSSLDRSPRSTGTLAELRKGGQKRHDDLVWCMW